MSRLRPGYVYVSREREPGVPERFSAVGPSEWALWTALRSVRHIGDAQINGERCHAFERTEAGRRDGYFDEFIFQPADRDDLWTPLRIRSGVVGLTIITPQGDA